MIPGWHNCEGDSEVHITIANADAICNNSADTLHNDMVNGSLETQGNYAPHHSAYTTDGAGAYTAGGFPADQWTNVYMTGGAYSTDGADNGPATDDGADNAPAPHSGATTLYPFFHYDVEDEYDGDR